MRFGLTGHQKQGFTLVELIMVILILSILGTLGYISYGGYARSAQDTSRLTQITNIGEAMKIYSITRKLPLPDDAIDILVNGEIVAYQGYAGKGVLGAIRYTNGGFDPKDNTYFTYATTKDRKSFQLLAHMNSDFTRVAGLQIPKIISEVYAADYSERYPRTVGDKIGILLSTAPTTLNVPVHEVGSISNIDLASTTQTYKSYLSDSDIIEGDSALLTKTSPIASCKRLRESGLGKNSGIYSVNPLGSGDISVYCDMETRGGGWMLVARSVVGGTGGFVWGGSRGSIQDLNNPYILGNLNGLTYSTLMLANYVSNRLVINATIEENSNANSFDVGTYSLEAGGITTAGPISGQGMFFVR